MLETDFGYALGLMFGAHLRSNGIEPRANVERNIEREQATPWLRDGRD